MEAAVSLAFHIEARTNANGEREIVSVDCGTTTDEPSNVLVADEIDVGSWQFQLVLPDDFDGSEAVFNRFRQYGLNPEVVHDACAEAMHMAG
jgi:hypothetical protein